MRYRFLLKHVYIDKLLPYQERKIYINLLQILSVRSRRELNTYLVYIRLQFDILVLCSIVVIHMTTRCLQIITILLLTF